MRENIVRRLEPKSRPVRGRDYVALELREAMEAGGWTAKKLADAINAETPYTLDYRTIQNAMGGSCVLDTFLALSVFFEVDWADRIIEQVRGESRLAALEREIARERAEIMAREARLEAERAARAARRGMGRADAPQDRPGPAPLRLVTGDLGQPITGADRPDGRGG